MRESKYLGFLARVDVLMSGFAVRDGRSHHLITG